MPHEASLCVLYYLIIIIVLSPLDKHSVLPQFRISSLSQWDVDAEGGAFAGF